MSQPGFFDFEQRQDQLDAHGNPLRVLEDAIDFEAFRQTLLKVRDKQRKSNAGRPGRNQIRSATPGGGLKTSAGVR